MSQRARLKRANSMQLFRLLGIEFVVPLVLAGVALDRAFWIGLASFCFRLSPFHPARAHRRITRTCSTRLRPVWVQG